MKFTTEYPNSVYDPKCLTAYSEKMQQVAEQNGFDLMEVKAYSVNIFKARLRANTVWTDPYTGMVHQIEREWWISDVNPTTEDFKSVSESQLPDEVWQSRVHPRWQGRLDRLHRSNVIDRNKLMREHPSSAVKAKVEELTNKSIQDSISKPDFRAAFEPLVYEAQYC